MGQTPYKGVHFGRPCLWPCIQKWFPDLPLVWGQLKEIHLLSEAVK